MTSGMAIGEIVAMFLNGTFLLLLLLACCYEPNTLATVIEGGGKWSNVRLSLTGSTSLSEPASSLLNDLSRSSNLPVPVLAERAVVGTKLPDGVNREMTQARSSTLVAYRKDRSNFAAGNTLR